MALPPIAKSPNNSLLAMKVTMMETAEVIRNEVRERSLEIEILLGAVERFADRFVEKTGAQGRDDHEGAHHEEPDNERGANLLSVRQREGQESNERDAGDAVGFKSVRGWAHGIARVVARAIRDHAGVLRVVFRAV